MSVFPSKIFLSKHVRELDRIAIEEFNVPSFTLMQRAGKAAFEALQAKWPNCSSLIVFAGPGNNGGDGYVIADLAQQAKFHALVIQVGDHSKLKGDAKQAHDNFLSNKGSCEKFAHQNVGACDVIVDALLGTGLTRTVEGDYAAAISVINNSNKPVLSADVPSGLDADHGMPLGQTVRADRTVTFVGMKIGLLTAKGRDYAGEVLFNDLQIPPQVYEQVMSSCQSINLSELKECLPARKSSSHKGDYGHTLIVGGNHGFAGSVMLAAEAAARAGSGLVSVATILEHSTAALQSCKEIMVHGVEEVSKLNELIEQATVIAIGPGLGQNAWAQKMLSRVLEMKIPLVVDADALNLLAKDPVQNDSWVLTPHPGEAARLLNISSIEIQKDRLSSVQALQNKFGGICVLKGSGTLVASSNKVSLCNAGNPGMASGGMGDVLTGIIASLIAQGVTLFDAASFGVQLHAESADVAANDGMRGMLASDLFNPLRKLLNS